MKIGAFFLATSTAPASIRPLMSFLVGILLSGFGALWFQLYETRKPAVQILRQPGEVAMVTGQSVVVHVNQERARAPCAGARADRVMINVKNGVNPDSGDFDALMFLREGRISTTVNGHHSFDLYLTLPQPLPTIAGGRWWYQANIYNGCDWLGRIFGQESPVPTPATPAFIVK